MRATDVKRALGVLVIGGVGTLLVQPTATAFWIRVSLVLTMTYFGYQTPSLPSFPHGKFDEPVATGNELLVPCLDTRQRTICVAWGVCASRRMGAAV